MCHGICDTNRRICKPKTENSNLQLACENVFANWQLDYQRDRKGILVSKLATGSLNELVEKCRRFRLTENYDDPEVENIKLDRIWNQLYEQISVELKRSMLN